MSSTRQQEARRERLEFERQFTEQARTAEDQAEYSKYVRQMQSEHLEPLTFEQWRGFVPADEQSPQLRGAIATANSTVNRALVAMRDRVATQPLDDETLQEYGFDLTDRVRVEGELSQFVVRDSLRKFVAKEPRWSTEAHLDALSAFMTRCNLYPTPLNLARAFCLLWNLGIIRPKPPNLEQSQLIEPQTSGLNEHGINLTVEPDQEVERRKAWERYTSEIVATDPRNGRTWTQYQLDHEASADEYRRLVFGELAVPKVTDVIGSNS